ncbi:MAG: primosomal protein [Actinomycetales bacterium]|nr:primosomal protein [Actinomycetales bacterium]
MTTDPRAALDRLIAALEAHLEAASRRRSETDPAVVAAYQTLADAFETYDEALYAAFDEVTPFVLYDDSEDEAEDDLDEDEEIDEDDLGEDDPFDDQVELDDDDDSDDDESEDDLDEDDAVSVDDGTGSEGSSGSR